MGLSVDSTLDSSFQVSCPTFIKPAIRGQFWTNVHSFEGAAYKCSQLALLTKLPLQE